MNLEINKNLLSVDNYIQVKTIKNDLIELEKITIYGEDLKVIRLDSYTIVIKGKFLKIVNGEEK